MAESLTERPYWNMEIEPYLGAERIRALQLERLRQRADQLFAHAPYFRRRMELNGVRSGADIRTLEDWARALPPFTKEDFRALFVECGMDIYRFLDEVLPVPISDLVCMAATSGTTGEPQPYPLTRSDIVELWGEPLRRMRWRCGVRPGDRVVHAFALSMFLAGVPALQFNADDGIMCIPVGAEAGVARILTTTRIFRGNVISCTPSLAEHMIERAPEVLGAPDLIAGDPHPDVRRRAGRRHPGGASAHRVRVRRQALRRGRRPRVFVRLPGVSGHALDRRRPRAV
jgi:phenylacetate-CoA ligase